MDQLGVHLKNIRVPTIRDNVYKDECVYSYDTPVSYNIVYNIFRHFHVYRWQIGHLRVYVGRLATTASPILSIFANYYRNAAIRDFNASLFALFCISNKTAKVMLSFKKKKIVAYLLLFFVVHLNIVKILGLPSTELS